MFFQCYLIAQFFSYSLTTQEHGMSLIYIDIRQSVLLQNLFRLLHMLVWIICVLPVLDTSLGYGTSQDFRVTKVPHHPVQRVPRTPFAKRFIRQTYEVNMSTSTSPTAKDKHFLDKERPTLYKISSSSSESSAATKTRCPKMCHCNATHANCSRHFGDLTYIPRLPESIQYLIFSFNNVSSIDIDDYFLNASQLTGLDLSNNGLTYVVTSAVQHLTKLETLILSFNRLGYSTLGFVSEIKSLKNLTLQHMIPKLDPIPNDFFNQHLMPGLETINFYDNALHIVKMTAFQPLASLKTLVLGTNFVYVFTADYMPQLTHLILYGNALNQFPETCSRNGSFFPKLKQLFLQSNIIYDIISVQICLPELEVLDLSRNVIREMLSFSFSPERFPSLREIRVRSANLRMTKVHRCAFCSHTLRVVSLLGNYLNFVDDNVVDPDAFENCSSVTDLQLQDNVFRGISDEKFRRLFGSNVPSLQQLQLSYCQITNITKQTFRGMSNLTHLYLSLNNLVTIPDGAFDSLTNAQTIMIRGNSISTVGSQTFGETFRNNMNLTLLDLSDNPFVCDCNLLWFQAWLASNYSLFHNREVHERYDCVNLPRTIKSFYLPQQACMLTHQQYVFMVVTLTFTLLAATFTSCIVRYRWRLKLLWYEAFRGGRDRRLLYVEGARWQYELYVCYAEEDVDWVRQHLVPRLEAEGLRVCVKDRDFPANRPEIGSMERFLEASKKMLIVFSSNFARDETCTFELSLCLCHALDHRDRPLVACIDDIPTRDLTADMLAVMKTNDYLQWADDEDVKVAFWGRLFLGLNDILPFH